MTKLEVGEVSRTILEAMEKSRLEYFKWNKDSLDSVPEYFLTVNIARELVATFGNGVVTFEKNVGEVTEHKAHRGRPRIYYDKNGRHDLALWAGEDLWGLIEVKKNVWTYDTATTDLKRIGDSLYAGSSKHLKAGFFTTYIERERTKRRDEADITGDFIDKLSDEWVDEMYEYPEFKPKVHTLPLTKYKIEYPDGTEDGHEAFQPICVAVTRGR